MNPQLHESEKNDLQNLFRQFHKPGHFFIASSGSAQKENQSLKLIALSKKAILASATAVNEHLQVTTGDIWGLALPVFHVGGLGILARSFQSGAQVVDALSNGKWDATTFLNICESKGVTLSALVPTQVFDLVQLGRPSPSKLRAIIIGGAELSNELYQKARKLGFLVLPSYGMTEVASQIATAEISSLKNDHYPQFKILSHCKVKVDSEKILSIQSSAMMSGYGQIMDGEMKWFDQPSGSWYQTSDRGEIENGYLKPLGRDESFVKILGEGVDLNRLRDRLNQIITEMNPELVLDVALVSRDDARRGHQLVFVCTKKISPDFLSELTLRYAAQSPKIEQWENVIWVDQIPRSALGKILWKDLKI